MERPRMHRRRVALQSVTARHTVYGILLGSSFPLLATLVDLSLRQVPVSIPAALWVHRQQPLHWLIDVLALLTIGLARLIGGQQERLRRSTSPHATTCQTDITVHKQTEEDLVAR